MPSNNWDRVAIEHKIETGERRTDRIFEFESSQSNKTELERREARVELIRANRAPTTSDLESIVPEARPARLPALVVCYYCKTGGVHPTNWCDAQASR